MSDPGRAEPRWRIIPVDTLPAASRELATRPGCRVLGGGTVLLPSIERAGWTGDLLSLAECAQARRLEPGIAGAAVSLADLGGAAGAVPAHLATAASRSVPSHVRAAATVGGNCAPEVTGCVHLVLLSLAAQALVVTAERVEERPLAHYQGGPVALAQLRWQPDDVAGGGFARSADRDAGGLPLCAVAITVTRESALRMAIGYMTGKPVILTVTDDVEGAVARWAAPHAPSRQQELATCLRQALSTL